MSLLASVFRIFSDLMVWSKLLIYSYGDFCLYWGLSVATNSVDPTSLL